MHTTELVRAAIVAGVLALSIGCEDSEPFVGPPDASAAVDSGVQTDAGVPDSGIDGGVVSSGLRIRGVRLTPASGTASGSGRRLRGGLVPSTRPRSENQTHRLNGGLVPSGSSR
ncbi:MAG: hypothetical protein AAF449_07730 [Myxococcota bacterium]